jgi:tetratricopeptide (TPR) repeat protein
MERIYPPGTVTERHDLLRAALSRASLKLRQFPDQLLSAFRQFSALIQRRDLTQALISADRIPTEGSRHNIGDVIKLNTLDGRSRRFKVCGIQSGGFSSVNIVIDLDEMRPYCLKENRAVPGDERSKNRRLAVEAEISLRLGRHPHIVETHGAFYLRNRLFILTEYVSATSLSKLIKSGPLPLDLALKYAIHLCRAITYAGSTLPGFIHGDIKPGNCLITQKGTLKLGDFGHASATGCGKDAAAGTHRNGSSSTASAGWGGTAGYMAPEMFDRHAPDRSAADIYAFGVTLFEMLCGSRPFTGQATGDIVEMHREAAPPLERLVELEVPGSLIDLIDKCLAKAPELRPRSFADVEDQLQRLYRETFNSSVAEESEQTFSDGEIAERIVSLAVLGHPEGAEAIADSRARSGREAAELLACKAIASVVNGRVDEAYSASTRALTINARSFNVLFAHASVLTAKGSFETAENYLYRAVRLKPRNCSALNLMGEVLVHLGDHTEASLYFRRSLAVDPEQTEALEGLARIELLAGRGDSAINLARKALSINDRSADAHRILGDVHFRRSHFVDAVTSYKTALRAEPRSKAISRDLVRCCCAFYRSTGRKIDLQLVKLLIRGANLQTSQNLLGDDDKFVADFLRFFDRSGSEPVLLFFFDDALMSVSECVSPTVSEKLRFCLTSLAQHAASRSFAVHELVSLGRVLYKYALIPECREIFETALEHAGPNGLAYYYLGACGEIEGDLERSLLNYTKASRLDDNEDTRTGIRRVRARMRSVQK